MRYAHRESGTALVPPALAEDRASRSSSNPFNKTALGAAIEDNMKQLLRASALAPAVALALACATVGGGSGGTVTNGGGGPGGQNRGRPQIALAVKGPGNVVLLLYRFAKR